MRINKMKSIGTLYIRTNWDFGVIIGGKSYCAYQHTLDIHSVDELINAVFTGPFGAPLDRHTQLDEIKQAFVSIISSASYNFSNLSMDSERGAAWTSNLDIE
jgi:hypothetical protein